MQQQGLYIQLFSVHGLIRSLSPELGRDADTGGQVKYVLELARALGEREDIAQVDLVTRLINDKLLSADYSVPIEPISEKVRIVRIQCGGRKYIRKELLWAHLEEFIARTIRFIKSQPRTPDVFHGHYSDAGYIAMELADAFDAHFIFTGHSLGRNKKEKLLSEGLSEIRINRQYKMSTRIDIEEKIINRAELIITSTRQEIEKQYGLYDNGRHDRFLVVPPGIDLENFYPFYDPHLNSELLSEEIKQTRVTLLRELHRFWVSPDKPFILALCRPDQRKNITGLIEAYGTCPELQTIANLAIFAGIRRDITTMEENEREVLTDMLLEMDHYDLYGKLAIPKRHDFATEVPELYRICAESHGVFVNPALVEPFGITLIEASASGLPIVATNNGGPVDIVGNCNNGLLVTASDPQDIAQALTTILVDQQKWSDFSNNGINGVRNHYSWQAHSEQTMQQLTKLIPGLKSSSSETDKENGRLPTPSFGRRLTNVRYLMITDIDNTLVGDNQSMRELFYFLQERQKEIAWGVATGRSLELTLEAMTEYNFPMPDILICSVGTEIYYGPNLRYDKGWQQYISYQWKAEAIKATLDEFDFLVFQEAEGQRSHKISYYLEDQKNNRFEMIRERLKQRKLRCQSIYSHGQFLDILPLRASKGRAIDYIRNKFAFSPRHVMVAGDSGNDEDMIAGSSRGLVVGNHSEELVNLRNRPNIYFSKSEYAAGIMDGLRHYGFY